MDETDQGRSGFAEFRGDLKAALKTWSSVPLLPVISLLVFVPASVVSGREPWGIAFLPLAIFGAGYVGTERLWYLAASRGETLSLGDVWRYSWSYFGRYLVLGMLVFGPLTVVGGVAAAGLGADDRGSPKVLLAWSAAVIVVDVWLTFVTPALAFSTHRVTDALSIGWGLLKREWPRTAVYALVPPMAVVAVTAGLPQDTLATGVRAPLVAASVLLNLWFKGAVAFFYLRYHPAKLSGTDAGPFSSARGLADRYVQVHKPQD